MGGVTRGFRCVRVRDCATVDEGYAYWTVPVVDEAVHDAAVDILRVALEQLRGVAVRQRGSLEGLHTIILPPDGHAKDSDEFLMRRWTVALTENPTDFVRRLSGVPPGFPLGYPLPMIDGRPRGIDPESSQADE